VSNPVGRLVGAGRAKLRRQRDRRPWLDHLVHAGGHYNRAQGDVLAAGVTYYVFLALFPVLLLVAAVAGFVLRGDPLLEDQLVRGIRDAVPGDTGRQLAEQVNGAVDSAGTFGLVGLAGFLLVGLGAMDKLRVGMDVVWRGHPDPPDFLGDRVKDLGALLGLGLAGALSIALTTGATAASSWALDLLGLEEQPGSFLLTGALAIGLALGGDVLVFLWVLKGVPGNPFGFRQLLTGAVFGAVGFEVLKLAGNWYLGRIGQNVTAQTLGSFVGLIVWINVVARFAFYTASWTATIRSIEHAHTLVPHGPAGPTPLPEVARVDERGPGPSPVRVAAGLLGVGALAGVVGSRLAVRRAAAATRRRRLQDG
jgi:membrane protein